MKRIEKLREKVFRELHFSDEFYYHFYKKYETLPKATHFQSLHWVYFFDSTFLQSLNDNEKVYHTIKFLFHRFQYHPIKFYGSLKNCYVFREIYTAMRPHPGAHLR